MRFATIPPIVLAFAFALLLAVPFSILAGRRGGRFRALPGWSGFWVFFAILLGLLSRAGRWPGFIALGALMFVGLKQYFFTTPVRPQDRWALFAANLAIPFALWPAFVGNETLYLALVPLGLPLLFPVLLSAGRGHDGLLDSIGRVLLGAVVFIVAMSHLGLMTHRPEGWIELYGILALVSDLVQRLAGRLKAGGQEVRRGLSGFVTSAAVSGALGYGLGAYGGTSERHGAIAGLIVACAVAGGALVAEAVAEEQEITTPSMMHGRYAFLDRVLPAIWAAPFFYTYLRLVS